MRQKIIWGVLIGVVSWIMTSFAGGIDGVKMMSTLGGLPALLIILGSAGSLIVLARSRELLAPSNKKTQAVQRPVLTSTAPVNAATAITA
ncbi:MAG: BCCT family transporter, partial [Glaciimonas sp.]|nr:BCCT family transporter [Glaciimonas sp.]